MGAVLGSLMVRGSFMQHSLEEGIKSTKLLIEYAKSRGITLVCANHLKVVREDGLPDYDYEKIVDWMIEHVKANMI